MEYTKCSTFNEMKQNQIPTFHNKRSSSNSNISNSNVQQRRKRFCQTIQYSPIVDATEHDSVGEILCSAADDGRHARNNDNNNNDSNMQNAITKVLIWKNRVVSQHIAHAIDCTVSIAQVLQRDLRKDHPSTGPVATITTNELRHLYSNIIVRCINGFADVLQQQRSVATSIAILCEEIGIPKYIVTIRHEATHNHLPSLSTLRIVAKTLLDYILNVYWLPMQQEHTLKPCQRAREALQYYEMAIQQHQLEQVEKQQQKQLQHEKSTVKSKNDVEYMDNNDDEEQDNDGDDDDDEIIMDGLFQSIPGTTSNRFAALIDATKKSTTKLQPPPPKPQQQQQPAVKGEMKIPPRKEQKTDRTGISPTTNTTNHERLVDHGPRPPWFSLATCAKAYMTPNESVSIDILQRVAIEHILTQTKHYVVSADHNLVSGGDKQNNNVQPEKQPHTTFLRRYRPLLGSIARVWPGFCSRFISHCLQEIIHLESFCRDNANGPIHVHDHPSDCDPLLYGTLLEGWIHLFLSNNFLLQIDVPPSTMVAIPNVAPSNNNNDSIQTLCKYNAIASSLIFKNENCIGKLDLFRKLQYPLNRWCDQLFETSSYGPDAPKCDEQSDSVPGRIMVLLVSRLGDDRTPLYGMDVTVPPPRTVQQSDMVTAEINDTTTDPVVPTRKSKTMSLEDMEAFLFHNPVADPQRHHHDGDDTSGAMKMDDQDNDQRRRSTTKWPFRNWVSCPTWEPCAIGTTFW